MVRSIAALLPSLAFAGIVSAQPITVSYYTDSCPASGTCDLSPAVPAGGFVLTDIVYPENTLGHVTLSEIIGQSVEAKLQVRVGEANAFGNFSYHFQSGVPFAGGSGIRTFADPSGGNRITLIGYVPSTARGVPAVSGFGMSVLIVLVVGAGGYVLRRSHVKLGPPDDPRAASRT